MDTADNLSHGWLGAKSPHWEIKTGSGVAKAILTYLRACEGDKSGEVWPGIKLIAQATEFGETAVKAALNALETGGHVQRRLEKKKTGGFRNRYRLTQGTGRHAITGRQATTGRETTAHRSPRDQRTGRHATKKVEVEVRSEDENLTTPRADGAGARETFKLFWTAYPLKIKKPLALKAWLKLSPPKALVKQILAAVNAQAADWENPRYIPHPDNWLRNRRWEDERPRLRAKPDHEVYVSPALIEVWNEHRGELMTAWSAHDHDARGAMALEPDMTKWTRAIQILAKHRSEREIACYTFGWLIKPMGGRLPNLERTLSPEGPPKAW